MKMKSAPFVFGTYRLSGEVLEDSLGQALCYFQEQGRPLYIDSAHNYLNIDEILSTMKRFPTSHLGWKIPITNSSSFTSSLAILTQKLQSHLIPTNRIFRILLHHYPGVETYRSFQASIDSLFGEGVMPIGVCNINSKQLLHLLENEFVRINYIQNEYHPFLFSTVPDICKNHSICFESHSPLTGIDNIPSLWSEIQSRHPLPLPLLLPQTPPQMAIAFASCATVSDELLNSNEESQVNEVRGFCSVCFCTSNWSHLEELCAAQTLSLRDLAIMREMRRYLRIVRYRGEDGGEGLTLDWVVSGDETHIKQKIIPHLLTDIQLFTTQGRIPSDLCVQIPKHYRPNGQTQVLIARLLYLDPESPLFNSELHSLPIDEKDKLARASQRLSHLLQKMRKAIEVDRLRKKREAKRATCVVSAVTKPSALPVSSYPEASEFNDLNAFLRSGGFQHLNRKSLPQFPEPLPFHFNQTRTGTSYAIPTSSPSPPSSLPNLSSTVRFKYGTLNSDGRYDLCKQGMRNAFIESVEAVASDAPPTISTSTSTSTSPPPISVRFKYGTLNSDGRYDLCKQGMRNAFIESVEAAAEKSTQGVDSSTSRSSLIKHFLIGNNRIGEEDVGGLRVSALASLIRRRPDIITWYLAGNELNEESIEGVAQALETSRARYVWFKMNPIKTGAGHLGRLIALNPHIELLDLFNCGVCDDGLEAFLKGIKDNRPDPTSPFHLKHLYLSINNLTSAPCLFELLSLLGSGLYSLFLGENPLGDQGLEETFRPLIQFPPSSPSTTPTSQSSDLESDEGIKTNTTSPSLTCSIFRHLCRVQLGALGLTDRSLPLLIELVRSTPTLISLDLSSYKSTYYFGQQDNQFSDIHLLEDLVRALRENARSIIRSSTSSTSIISSTVISSSSTLLIKSSSLPSSISSQSLGDGHSTSFDPSHLSLSHSPEDFHYLGIQNAWKEPTTIATMTTTISSSSSTSSSSSSSSSLEVLDVFLSRMEREGLNVNGLQRKHTSKSESIDPSLPSLSATNTPPLPPLQSLPSPSDPNLFDTPSVSLEGQEQHGQGQVEMQGQAQGQGLMKQRHGRLVSSLPHNLLKELTDPHPAIDYIRSIYRNNMN